MATVPTETATNVLLRGDVPTSALSMEPVTVFAVEAAAAVFYRSLKGIRCLWYRCKHVCVVDGGEGMEPRLELKMDCGSCWWPCTMN